MSYRLSRLFLTAHGAYLAEAPIRMSFVKLCHCEKRQYLSRRANPPEGYHINAFRKNKGAATSKPSPLGRRCHAVTDEGQEVNTYSSTLL